MKFIRNTIRYILGFVGSVLMVTASAIILAVGLTLAAVFVLALVPCFLIGFLGAVVGLNPMAFIVKSLADQLEKKLKEDTEKIVNDAIEKIRKEKITLGAVSEN